MTDSLARLRAAGVSIWLDDLSRDRLISGSLVALARDKHVSGVTTNPTIFARSIIDTIEHRQFGLIPSQYSGLAAAEHTDIYYQTDGQPLNGQQQVSRT